MDTANQSRTARRRASDLALLLCGVWLIGLGLYFALLRPPLLAEDNRFIGPEVELAVQNAPALLNWLHRIFLVMGGFIAASGLLLIHAVRSPSLSDRPDSLLLLLIAGAASVGLMSVVNFAIGSDFRWLLFLPALAWAAALWLRR